MDSFAIPFPTGRTVAERPGESNGDDDLNGDHDATSRGRLQLAVTTRTLKVIHVEAYPSDSVLELKQRIEDKTAVPVDQQMLFYRSRKLADSDTLEECGLSNGCRIFLILNLRGGGPMPVLQEASSATGFSTEAESIKVSIWIQPGKYVVVESHLGATIGSVKQSIEKQTGLRAAHQTLTLGGEDMSDEHTLAQYGLRERCTLFLAANSVENSAAPATAVTHRPESAETGAGIVMRIEICLTL